MVKVRPTGAAPTSRIPPTAVGGWLRFDLPDSVSRVHSQPGRSDFNHPPTAVGGIRERNGFSVGRTLTIPQLPLGGLKSDPQICEVSLKSRFHIFSNLNHPPTAVGGIEERSPNM